MNIKFFINNFLLILTSIFIFNGCSSLEGESLDDSVLTNTEYKCIKEIEIYKRALSTCSLIDRAEKVLGIECSLYKDTYKYSETELQESRDCANSISALSCEELEDTSSLDDIDGCPSFKTKPIKSKKEVCAENYLLFCENQFGTCGEDGLDAQCEAAKYTKTNSQGLDAKTSFKMNKLLEHCDSEADIDASLNDLDCIIQVNNSSTIFSCQKTFEVFRSDCTKYFD